MREARVAHVLAATVMALSADRSGHAARGFVTASTDTLWFAATAPGQPATTSRSFLVVRCEGTSGVIRSVWAWSPRVESVAFEGDRVAISLGSERHVHWQMSGHWQVELTVGGAHSGIELTGWRGGERTPDPWRPGEMDAGSVLGVEVARAAPLALRRGTDIPLEWALGEGHYRRSEETWTEAGRPRAGVSVIAVGDELVVVVNVTALGPSFVPDGATNPYDNEEADVNGFGVQLYVATPEDTGAWMIVPEIGATKARVRPLPGWGELELRRSTWRPTPDGFELRAHVGLGARAASGDYPIALDVLVNETAPGRARRRGQLVLSGAEGEFVYLRGDRHDPARLVPVVITG